MSTDTVNQKVPAGVWTVDPVHSSISFAITHNNVATYRSGFETYEATLTGGERRSSRAPSTCSRSTSTRRS